MDELIWINRLQFYTIDIGGPYLDSHKGVDIIHYKGSRISTGILVY